MSGASFATLAEKGPFMGRFREEPLPSSDLSCTSRRYYKDHQLSDGRQAFRWIRVK
jgi:hypothetical protein